MTTMTKRDAVDAAMTVAEQIADGRLDPSALQAQTVIELRELVGTVLGEGDPLFDLQCQIARGVLAADGIPASELAEWLAVARNRAGEPLEPTAPHDDPLPAVSSASVDESGAESTTDDGDTEPAPLQGVSIVTALAALASAAQQAHVEPTPTPAPPRRADSGGYDVLRGFDPGATRRF